ncbi:MAG: hypothetical protein ACXWC9_01455, partial [Pseudobdellovibrionaceae bacterium]
SYTPSSTNHIATPAYLFLGCWLTELLVFFAANKLMTGQQASQVIWLFSVVTWFINLFAVSIIISFLLNK